MNSKERLKLTVSSSSIIEKDGENFWSMTLQTKNITKGQRTQGNSIHCSNIQGSNYCTTLPLATINVHGTFSTRYKIS